MNSKRQAIREFIEHFSAKPKRISSKYFYDRKGSRLFDQICSLEEYYLTRTEMRIMEDNIEAISGKMGKKPLVLELGAGNLRKIEFLLDHLNHPQGYVPVDVSKDYLHEECRRLRMRYPKLKLVPVVADYTKEFDVSLEGFSHESKVVYYPGSSIGNFKPETAKIIIENVAAKVGEGTGFLIGVDLIKDRSILEKAYNDSKGITAEFNLNILNNLNRLFGTNFQAGLFSHHAVYNERNNRIEMYLFSLKDQQVKLNGNIFSIKKNEIILTEYSYKYDPDSFARLFSDFMRLEASWMDSKKYFGLFFFRVI